MTATQIELLAPAGCFAALQAALDAGADAIYFGIGNLNMRAVARRSFDTTDLPEILSRIKSHNPASPVKAYLTLNTVVYDHELNRVRETLTLAKAHHIDAVIASDMAVVNIASELDIPVHLSTQLSISNYAALKHYAPLCERIVLARELSLNKISRIHEQIQSNQLLGSTGKLMEIEAFAHGALCVAVSGRCNMSLHQEGPSANRGACRQMCRRQYKMTDLQTGDELVLDNNYIMSPSDLTIIDFLDQAIDAGITTLKIEGRGRSPEYVATVTRAFRKAITAIQTDTYDRPLIEELFTDLKSVYNRGLSSGFYLGKKHEWSGKAGSKATRKKVIVGPITNFFTKQNVAEIHAQAAPVSIGDDYLIIGPTTGVLSGTITELHIDNQPENTAPQGVRFSIKLPQRARRSDTFYLSQKNP
ncbi:peptidase U32 family protein [Poriferisphaera sp. WC338]|uniref:peptidase U32 family protein n=1 Tax=Poriferisphaera sp. WC338 TaxID=3425129 RepID=UPI003D8140AE